MSLFREHVVKRFSKKRSPYWGRIRKAHVRAHPHCQCCGRKRGPEVHHIKDFSTHPGLELATNNLITLCRKRCHIMIGHLLNWKSINPEVEKDSGWFLKKVRTRR